MENYPIQNKSIIYMNLLKMFELKKKIYQQERCYYNRHDLLITK